MNKVVCIGESLIDFMPCEGELTFQAKAGGAPSNVCACVAKLGGNGCYLGKLSTDIFSIFLYKTMQKWGVNVDYTVIDAKYQTALAFVSHNENGDREFNFYRKNTCDLMLNEEDIKQDIFKNGDILHFCSLGLVESPSKYAHKKAINLAKKAGCIISFDVNVREKLWDSEQDCVNAILEFLPYADLVKVTDDELLLITKEQDEKKAIQMLFERAKNSKLIIVTKGAKGAVVYDRQLDCIERQAVDVKVLDTTGAGDCFIGCILYQLACKNANLSLDGIKNAIDFASYGSAIVIGSKGAIECMPTQSDIENLKNKIEV